MKTMRGRWMKTGAALIAGLLCLCIITGASAAPAVQVIDARDLMARLQRLERDMRDVQSETFRRAPNAAAGAAPAPAAAAANAAPAPTPVPEAQSQQPIPDLNPMMRRLGDLEESLGRLTGQIEEIGHQVDQLSQKTDRLQKQMDFQAAQTMPLGGIDMPMVAADQTPPAGDNTLASLTPDQSAPLRGAPPANLGQIPSGARLPVAAPPADPKREFDAAMNLLSRAQYDPARDAFRKFADAHPDEDRASDALYWTGDIAYSAKKDYPAAARDFAELLKKYPKAQRAPEGMLKLGLALFELGQMKEGCAALAALPAKYPDASPAVASRAKTERAGNKCK